MSSSSREIYEIVVDDKPGQEALYLIFSRIELSRADPRLAEAVTTARQAGKAAECGEHFRTALTGPPHSSKPERSPPQREGGSSAGSDSRSAPGGKPPILPPEGGKPIVDIERGGDIGWNGGFGVTGDFTGIAILRYGLTHMAAK